MASSLSGGTSRRFTIRGVAHVGEKADVILALIASASLRRPIVTNMPKVDVALADLTMRDITLLGDGLMYCLKHELSEEDAVDRFALSFISMAQLREEHALFSVALERFCKRILSDQQKWAKVKLFVAAAISIIDTVRRSARRHLTAFIPLYGTTST